MRNMIKTRRSIPPAIPPTIGPHFSAGDFSLSPEGVWSEVEDGEGDLVGVLLAEGLGPVGADVAGIEGRSRDRVVGPAGVAVEYNEADCDASATRQHVMLARFGHGSDTYQATSAPHSKASKQTKARPARSPQTQAHHPYICFHRHPSNLAHPPNSHLPRFDKTYIQPLVSRPQHCIDRSFRRMGGCMPMWRRGGAGR